MAYGGLRGAVAFSLVKMLVASEVRSKPLFLTTTLVVILFTVFIQGGSIKVFVNLLNIEKSGSKEETFLTEVNNNVSFCTIQVPKNISRYFPILRTFSGIQNIQHL